MVKINEELKPCGAIYLTDEILKVFEEIVGKENWSIKKLYVRQISADFLNRQIYNTSCNLFIDTYCIRFEQKKEENTMNYSCYISKHLYERVKSAERRYYFLNA